MKGTEKFAADLAKVCRRARANLRTAARTVFCSPQTAASSMLSCRLFMKLAPLALIVSLLGGCTGGCSREQPQQPPEESVVKRMEDPVYRSQLENLRAAQNEIAERASAISKELEAARAENPESAKTKEFEKKYAAVLDEMEALRAKALVAVRNRMLQDEANAKSGSKKASSKSR